MSLASQPTSFVSRVIGMAGRLAYARLYISQPATLYTLCLTLMQQEIQLEHTRKQHVVPHEAHVPERNFSPVQVSLQKAKILKIGFV